MSVLKNILYKIIRAIFSLFPDNTTSVYEPEKQEQMTGGGATLLEGGEASMFWKILEVVAILALLAAIVLGIIYGIRQFIAFVNKMMGKRGISHDKLIRSTDSLDVREKCEVQKKKGQSKHALDFWGFLDSKERIRKIYKKKAAAYKPNPLTNGSAQKKDDYSPERVAYYTAREMERQMQSNPFADIYEKARYSNEECTSQDVKRMKENCV